MPTCMPTRFTPYVKMILIKNIYHVLSIITIFISITVIKKKLKINKENFIVIHTILIFNFFDIYFWILPKYPETVSKGLLAYEIIFPIFIISTVLLKKNTIIPSVLAILTSIAFQFIFKTSNQIPISGIFKMGLSFSSSLAILFIVFRNLKKIKLQVFLLLLISGITLIDMFITAAYYKLIPFKMNLWNTFLSYYITYLSINCCIFIYYYGKQLLRNSTISF